MDELKLDGKCKEHNDSLVRTVHIVSTDIGIEFGYRKCGLLILKMGKVVRNQGIELPNGQTMKEVEQEGYKYLGIVELD